jgi:pentatricopeptide repeat protein
LKKKLQQTEDLLLKFLKEETDFTLKTFLTGALCKHGNPNALMQLFDLMEEGGEDSLSELGDYVYIPCLFNDEVISRMDF